MTTYRSMSRMASVLAMTLSLSAVAGAQDSFQKDLRSQPYVYGSIGAFPSGAGGPVTYGLGFGIDFLTYKGLGFGGELAAFGNNAFGFGVTSFTTSYHFVRPSSRVVPFVKAGIGTGGEIGYGGVTFASFGGGVNLWKFGGTAFRVEVVDRFPASGGDHHINVQLGITF